MYCEWPGLRRCCFCLPLRRGVLTFAYLSFFFSAFLVGVYSYCVHEDLYRYHLSVYHGSISAMATELCIALYCLDAIFSAILIYGAHTKHLIFIKIYYYYAITTFVATLLIQIIDMATSSIYIEYFSVIAFVFIGICIQLYVLMLVTSLLRKLEVPNQHVYENQLHQFVNGERKVELNGIYDNTTVVPIDDV